MLIHMTLYEIFVRHVVMKKLNTVNSEIDAQSILIITANG